jgi:alkylmercury lyase
MSGYREYDDTDVARLRFIQRAKDLGFTLKEIAGLFSLRVDQNTTCADVRQLAQKKIESMEARIEGFQDIIDSLDRLVHLCDEQNGSSFDCPIWEELDTVTESRPSETNTKAGMMSEKQRYSAVDHTTEISTIIETLVERWRGTQINTLRPAFLMLAEGGPVSIERLADSTGGELSVIKAAADRARVDIDRQGRVRELFGVTVQPTSHRIDVDGVAIFSCCALVAQMLPSLVAKTVNVESLDPISHEIIRLTITPDGILSLEPKGTVATLMALNVDMRQRQLTSIFCNHVNLFASVATAEEFVAAASGRFIIGIKELNEVGRRLYSQIWN